MKRIVLYSLLVSAAPALADATYQTKTIDCYCTDTAGSRVELGQMICLHVGGRSFMAQCQMSLNNPMWREISEGCLSSSLGEPHQPGVDASPIHAHI